MKPGGGIRSQTIGKYRSQVNEETSNQAIEEPHSQIIEVFTHPDDGTIETFSPRDIRLDEISAWFAKSFELCEARQAAQSPKSPGPGAQRFVVVDVLERQHVSHASPRTSREAVDLCDREIKAVMRKLNLDILGVKDSVSFTKFPQPLNHEKGAYPSLDSRLTYRITAATFDLAWSYFPETDQTLGVVVHSGPQSSRIARKFLDKLVAHQGLANHPILPALLAHLCISPEMERWLEIHASGVQNAQSQTGYHSHLDFPQRATQGQLDYAELSATVSGVAANIATNRFCWQGLLRHANAILEETKNFAHSLPLQKQDMTQVTTAYILQHASHLSQKSERMIEEADSWQRKATIQVQGLFNLIAQRDQMMSIDVARDTKKLAEDSKRDTTSMKAIAAVTIFFLPGTFAAVSPTNLFHHSHPCPLPKLTSHGDLSVFVLDADVPMDRPSGRQSRQRPLLDLLGGDRPAYHDHNPCVAGLGLVAERDLHSKERRKGNVLARGGQELA
jgi:hypothetical protein